jgi:hypothetical protein
VAIIRACSRLSPKKGITIRNVGMMDEWNVGFKIEIQPDFKPIHESPNPLFQYSSVPLFQLGRSP